MLLARRAEELPVRPTDDFAIGEDGLAAKDRAAHNSVKCAADVRTELMAVEQVFALQLVASIYIDQRHVGIEANLDRALLGDAKSLGGVR